MRLQQMAKAQDGALIGQMLFSHVEPGKLAKHRCVVQRLFHGRVRQVAAFLQEVDAQHGLNSEWRAAALGATQRCMHAVTSATSSD